MSDATRRLLIDRLGDLGEFDRALHDTNHTRYDRAQEREAGLSPEWVERRRDELANAAWKYWSMIFGIVTGPFLMLLPFFEIAAWNGAMPEIALVVAGVVAIAGGTYRISTLMNYVRRRQLYDLLDEIEEQKATSDAADHASTLEAEHA
ncbi:hypothetical protein [Longibacter sp.]|uniref:hypothetical protein n=1 Tax=Longibacter sp. TaxID=2045415 RepID=UPI003EBBDE31